jgi:hypothetical protein
MLSEHLVKPSTTARAWCDRSQELAAWVWAHLVNRLDAWGAYGSRGPYTGKGELTLRQLRQHFAYARRWHIIGLHSTGTDGSCRWAAVDIDAHPGDPCDPAANRRAALAWLAVLVALGFRPLLSDSNGRGGFHLLVIFRRPIPAALAYAFLRWLTRDFAAHGFPKRPECFPKQPRLGGLGFGNWLRVVGRHYKHDHWSRVWDGERWLDGAAAVDFILRLDGDEPGRIPAEARREEAPPVRRADPLSGTRGADVSNAGEQPGDVFEREASWADVLGGAGWKLSHKAGTVEHWTRPQKDGGTSATLGFCQSKAGGQKLYIFTSNGGPLEQGQTYSKFAAYAALHHEGDFKAAARAIALRFGLTRPERPARAKRHKHPLRHVSFTVEV